LKAVLRSGLLYDTLQTLPTAKFFIITSTLSAFVLLARRVKPIASCILALSVPGTIGAALSFPLFAAHFAIPAANMRFSLTMALIATTAFPSNLIAPAVFIASVRRYRSNKDDYAIGFGVFAVACLLIIAAALSHLLATAKDDPL
jgi:hypothetical protein